jgi:hypothetical protein
LDSEIEVDGAGLSRPTPIACGDGSETMKHKTLPGLPAPAPRVRIDASGLDMFNLILKAQMKRCGHPMADDPRALLDVDALVEDFKKCFDG